MSGRYVPRVTAELPEGWSGVETAELFGPDGLQIRVTAQPVHPNLDTQGLADRHGQMLASQITGYCDHGVERTTAFSGHDVLRRCFEGEGALGPSRGITAYLVHSGRGFVASATGPAEVCAARESEVLSIIDGLLVLGDPLATGPIGAGDDGDRPVEVRPAGSPRPPVPDGAWGGVREAWSDHDEAAAPAGPGMLLSDEELLVVAATVGCGTFPGVDPRILGVLPRGERESIARAIARSLVLRGVLVEQGGELCPDPAWASLLDVALYPDLHVESVVTTGDGSTQSVWCVRPDALVRSDPAASLGREVAPGRPGDLVRSIVDQSGLASAEGPGRRTAGSLDELIRTVKVRTTWRDGSALVGGELLWAVDTEGGLYAFDGAPEPGAGVFPLRPASLDDVWGEVLAHLPPRAPSS